MNSKYSQEFVMDITKTFIQNDDFKFIQQKMYEETNYPRPHNISCYSYGENSMHGKVDEKALAYFGEQLLNNQLHANINAYHLTLPSVNEAGSNHALALMLDKKDKEIWYQDSYGVDMRKELHDFFKVLFPDYKITCFNQIQQYKRKNDNSCFLLAEYNLIDMWHSKSGHPEKRKEYDSYQARTAVWDIVKQIEEQPAPTLSKPKFSFGSKIAVELPKKFLLEQRRNTQRNFKYSILKQKNYKELLEDAANIARLKHKLYKKRLMQETILVK